MSHQLCVLAYNFSFKVDDDVIDVNLRRQCLLYGQLTSETPKTFLTEDWGICPTFYITSDTDNHFMLRLAS